MTLRTFADAFRRPASSTLFAVGFVAAAICCALATALALYGPAGPQSDGLLVLVGGALALILLLTATSGLRLVRVLRRRMAGAPAPRLHLRFVALFSFAAVTPAVLMAVFFGVLLSRGLETWFGEQVEASVESARETAQFYLDQIVDQAAQDALITAADLAQPDVQAAFEEDPQAIAEYLEQQARLRAMTAVHIIDGQGEPIVGYESEAAPPYRAPMPDDFVAARGDVDLDIDQEAQVLRFLTQLEGYDGAYLYTVPDVSLALFDALEGTARSISSFQEARDRRGRIQVFFVLIYLEAAMLILAGSVWLALSAAGRVAAPVGRLVEAADRVGQGDLGAHVDVGEDRDEIAALGRAFNLMTDQLERQRGELVDANAESEERRRLIETVLLGVSAGVLSVDAAGVIRLANRSAADLLGVAQPALREAQLQQVAPLLADIAARARARPGDTMEAQVELDHGDGNLVLNVRAAADEGGQGRVVLTFDDITRLIAAQRNAAWRDVARRIAHEIKNPLTPIQLSAERLRRRYRPQDEESAQVFDRCTETIVRQVSDIGRMVDEFSAFARMPTPRIEPVQLEDMVHETVFARRVASPDIRISLDAPEGPISVSCDARLASQALTNILKNAAESIEARVEADEAGRPEPGQIEVSVYTRDGQGVAEIADNGLGWPGGARERLTEPYMTTREKGTGLGLAIVQRIMEDHGGALELDARSDARRGAVVRLAFPLAGEGRGAEAAE